MPTHTNQQSGGSITIKDEGITLGSASSIDLVGAGVTGSIIGDAVTIDIPGGGGSSFTIIKNEVPSGVIDGSNATFTLAHTPLYGVELILNGATLKPGDDYTITGLTITFVIPPAAGSLIICHYEY